jgi:hypothetical protein
MDASKIKKEAPAGGRPCFEWFHFHDFVKAVIVILDRQSTIACQGLFPNLSF